MTREELAVKYGYYRWDDKGGYYVCSHNFLYDLDRVIKEEMSNCKMYQIMRRQLVETITGNNTEEQMWRDIQEADKD